MDFFQVLSELCFPTWLFAFSKVCFKLSDQASMQLSIPTRCLGEAALLCFHRLCNYYCIINAHVSDLLPLRPHPTGIGGR